MQLRFDQDANTLYIAIRAGEIARTVELTDLVYVDVDASGDPLGIEFAKADELVTSLRRLGALEQSHE